MKANNKKSLDEVLSRNDYKRLTTSLKERVEDIATRIRKKMEELDIPNDENFYRGEVGVGDVVVSIKSIRSKYGSVYEFLALREFRVNENDEGVYTSWLSLEDVNRDFWFGRDSDNNTLVHGASSEQALAFLNVAKHIIEGLGKIEEEKAKAIEKALDETENIK